MKEKLKLSGNNKGFSLIEVLLAVVLLAIVITPLIGTIYTSLNLNQNSKKMMAATDLSQDILEYYESMVLDDVIADLDAFGGTGSSTVSSNPKPFGYVRSGMDNVATNVGLNGIRSVEQTVLKSTNLHAANSEDTNNVYKCIVNSGDVLFYGITDVSYEGYKFDVFVSLELNPSCSLSDEYYIYNIKVEVYEVNKNKKTNNSLSGRIVSDNVNDYTPMTSYSGSVFNKID